MQKLHVKIHTVAAEHFLKDSRKCAGRRGHRKHTVGVDDTLQIHHQGYVCTPRNMLELFNQWRAERLLNAGWFTQQGHTPRWICKTYTICITYSISYCNELNPHHYYCHICAQKCKSENSLLYSISLAHHQKHSCGCTFMWSSSANICNSND